MNDYDARKAAKVARYRQYAENAQQRSEAALQRSHDLVAGYPMGQPILVGHHSEKTHRNAIKKSHAAMDRFCAELKKAEYWRGCARAAEQDTSIRHRDPDAITKLEAKIAELEAQRNEIKAVNQQLRTIRFTTTEEVAAKLAAAAIPDRYKRSVARSIAVERYHYPVGTPITFPSYHLTNLGANIRRYKVRLVELQRQAAMVAAGGEVAERPRYMTSKRRGPCAACPTPIERGDFIAWYRQRGEAEHHTCPAVVA